MKCERLVNIDQTVKTNNLKYRYSSVGDEEYDTYNKYSKSKRHLEISQDERDTQTAMDKSYKRRVKQLKSKVL